MDEDLKIVLTSELEADEEASAQRISAQLPNIAKLINSKSSIKVGVTLDEAGIQSQTQRITQQIARATKSQSVGVSLSLNQSSVNKIKTELNNLKVSPDISRAMTDQLDQMGIQIDRITGRWEAVNGEEERMLNLTIQGTDQMQRTVTYLQTYNAETGEINTHLTNVTANLERQRREQEQVAAQAKKDNESRVSYLNRQKALLADIQAAYVGQTSVKPITDSAHLTALNDTYAAVNARIETMIAAEGRLDNVQRSNLEAQISGLQRLVKEYQNAEYVATKLRTKDIGSIKADQLSGLEALEKRLESAGTLTDTFKSKIDGLKKTLQGVGTKDQLVAFLNSFDQLNNDVAVFQERLRGANKIYTQLISLDKQITSVQSSMTKLNTSDDKNKLLALQGQLSVLNNQRAALEAQLVPYADIIQYAKQATALEQSRLLNGTQLVYAQMELADKARDYDVAMQGISPTIADLQTKFSQVVAPTENLVQNMRLLRETAAQYGADMGDREKVATYERLQSLIGACSKEMYANSKQHAYEDAAGKLYLNRRNLELGAQLAQYGITAVRGSDGVWYVDRVGGQLLYDKYRKYTYHEGGIVGGGDIKSNEQLSLLKTKEWVLSEQMVDNLTTQMDRINMLSDAMSDLPDYAGKSTLSDVMKQVGGSKTVNNITNNSRPIEVQIGDTIIHGADQSTVDKHIKVTRDMVNQIGRLIGIGR